MSRILEKIDYKGIFRFFEEISNVPRGSKYNQLISDYLVQFAKERGLEHWQDEAYNVVIIKEATVGCEAAPTVIIQGHMDMVCEKRPDVKHDFTKEGLKLKVDGDLVYADGTTLGGDDGIAIAYALAILDDNTLVHPRLEVVITTDEEIGMEGATALDCSKLRGKYMFNIDSEEEGIFLSSAAGGLRGNIRIPVEYEDALGMVFALNLEGLQGGHSGTEINKNRINADVLMGRLLFELSNSIDYKLMKVEGGLKDNSIPRESTATIVINEKDETAFRDAFYRLSKTYMEECSTNEPDLTFSLNELAKEQNVKVFTQPTFRNVMHVLLYAPNGVQTMSANIEGLVESSLNLGILKLEKDHVLFGYAVRSSVSTYKYFMNGKLQYLAESLGGNYEMHGDYASWEYKKDSKLRELMVKTYRKDYGSEPTVEALHAGLECGVLAGKIEGLDIVSFGPNIYDIHTPEERLSISSTKRVYDYVIHCLKELCEGNE